MNRYKCTRDESDDSYYIERYYGWKYLGFWYEVAHTHAAYESRAWEKLDIELNKQIQDSNNDD